MPYLQIWKLGDSTTIYEDDETTTCVYMYITDDYIVYSALIEYPDYILRIRSRNNWESVRTIQLGEAQNLAVPEVLSPDRLVVPVQSHMMTVYLQSGKINKVKNCKY